MAPLVADLSDADMRDLSAYYAYLPRPSDLRASTDVPPRIVANGASIRGIAPCGACHGELDSKPGAAWLEGQPAVYLRLMASSFRLGDVDGQSTVGCQLSSYLSPLRGGELRSR